MNIVAGRTIRHDPYQQTSDFSQAEVELSSPITDRGQQRERVAHLVAGSTLFSGPQRTSFRAHWHHTVHIKPHRQDSITTYILPISLWIAAVFHRARTLQS